MISIEIQPNVMATNKSSGKRIKIKTMKSTF